MTSYNDLYVSIRGNYMMVFKNKTTFDKAKAKRELVKNSLMVYNRRTNTLINCKLSILELTSLLGECHGGLRR